MAINKNKVQELVNQVLNHEQSINSETADNVTRNDVTPSVMDLNELEKKKSSVRKRKRWDATQPLRDLRLLKGLTLDELADQAEVSTSYLSRLESGSRRLNVDIITKLAKSLDCHPGDLLAIDNPVNRTIMEGVKTLSSKNVHPSNENLAVRDLPVFEYKKNKVDLNSAIDWRLRSNELMGDNNGLMIYIGNDDFAPRYKKQELVMVSTIKSISPQCSVVIVTNNNELILAEFIKWQIVGKQESNEDMLIVKPYGTQLVSKFPIVDGVVNIKREQVDRVNRVIGAIES